VLLDEPFGALDPVTRERMQEEFVALARELDKTYVFVTHDMREAVRLGDRIAVMDAGRLIRCATPTQLLRDPGSETAAALLGAQRIQLRLMTTRLADLPTSSEAPPNADTAVELSDQDTVWDALTACERERASCVVVQGRWVSREILVSIVLPSKTRA
jgi:osmoprotectant transport system ATP-binding protein